MVCSKRHDTVPKGENNEKKRQFAACHYQKYALF